MYKRKHTLGYGYRQFVFIFNNKLSRYLPNQYFNKINVDNFNHGTDVKNTKEAHQQMTKHALMSEIFISK